MQAWGPTIIPADALSSFEWHLEYPERYNRTTFELFYGSDMYLACARRYGLRLDQTGQTDC